MFTENEEKFLKYWQEKRQQNKLNPFFFIRGFATGLIVGLLVILCLAAGWYKRANMDANTKLNPYVLIISVVLMALFFAWFYNSFKYDQNEQQYQILLKKKNKMQE